MPAVVDLITMASMHLAFKSGSLNLAHAAALQEDEDEDDMMDQAWDEA